MPDICYVIIGLVIISTFITLVIKDSSPPKNTGLCEVYVLKGKKSRGKKKESFPTDSITSDLVLYGHVAHNDSDFDIMGH